jgi:putative ABC transport system permease protein
VYGLVAYTVKQKAHEIGVRSALGATRASLVRHLLSGVTILAASGAGLGVVVALGVGQAMSQLLFGVAATDLTSFTVATLVVLASALAASLAPAWRAARQDPIAALRHR